MTSNGPSRTFTREAVEAWLARLSTADWETNIPKTQLQEGRKFYREGMLSTIDLQSGQAVVTQKVNREETYSVIEWNGKGPEIRTSVEDEEFGIVLATAGLYEIEELIAEIHEDDPLLDDLARPRGRTKTARSRPRQRMNRKKKRVPTKYLSTSCLKFPTKTDSPPPPCGKRMQRENPGLRKNELSRKSNGRTGQPS